MNIEEARSLLFFEASAPNGIVVASRVFEFPNVLRIEVLCEALEQIYLHYKSIDKIERKIACALFNVSFHVQSNIEAAMEQEVEISEDFLEDILMVYIIVESIFENKWLVSDNEPKPNKSI